MLEHQMLDVLRTLWVKKSTVVYKIRRHLGEGSTTTRIRAQARGGSPDVHPAGLEAPGAPGTRPGRATLPFNPSQPYPKSLSINKIQPPQTGSTPEFSEFSRVEFRRVGYSD